MSNPKVAINGFGRIGRCVLRAALEQNAPIDFVAINDLTNPKTLAHLFKYDSVMGVFKGKVSADGETIHIEYEANGKKTGKSIKVLSERDITKLPWKDFQTDIVVESTGLFRKKDQAMNHINNGAKKVIISAPAKNEDITIVMGVNEDKYKPSEHHIISNASCTTNCLAPVAKVLDEAFGIKYGLMTTIHSYTNDQIILDSPHSDLRRARAAAVSMIPTSTGAAQAVALVLPQLKGKFTGMAVRVPTPNVSLVDLSIRLGKEVTVDEVNNAIKSKADTGSLKGILFYCDEELVSVDFMQNPYSSIFDSLSTLVIGENPAKGDFVKVLSWYDNEWGYSSRVIDLIQFISR